MAKDRTKEEKKEKEFKKRQNMSPEELEKVIRAEVQAELKAEAEKRAQLEKENELKAKIKKEIIAEENRKKCIDLVKVSNGVRTVSIIRGDLKMWKEKGYK